MEHCSAGRRTLPTRNQQSSRLRYYQSVDLIPLYHDAERHDCDNDEARLVAVSCNILPKEQEPVESCDIVRQKG